MEDVNEFVYLGVVIDNNGMDEGKRWKIVWHKEEKLEVEWCCITEKGERKYECSWKFV